MNGWELTRISLAVGSAVAVLLGGFWFGGQVINSSYPREPGYPIEGVPTVDLASVQRSWPGGISEGDADKLIGYIGRIEKAVVQSSSVGPGAQAQAMSLDLGSLLAAADAGRGQRSAQLCSACHTFTPGGANGVGPNLHGIVGRAVGGKAGFAYSGAMKGHGGRWTYEELDAFLASPARTIPGTKMSFSGIRNPRDRANVIAYLASTTPGAPPFPQAFPAEASADSAQLAN